MKKKEQITPPEEPIEEKVAIFDIRTVKTALVLLLVTGITVLLLAFVNYLTKAPIEERRQKELADTIGIMFPNSVFNELDTEFEYSAKAIYEISSEEGKMLGYAVMSSAQGFGGEMSILVGLDTDGSVKGVKIMEDSETATKVAPVKDEAYLSKYIGKKGKLEFGKDGLDAVSSSTISSGAVLDGVNSATSAVSSLIQKGENR